MKFITFDFPETGGVRIVLQPAPDMETILVDAFCGHLWTPKGLTFHGEAFWGFGYLGGQP